MQKKNIPSTTCTEEKKEVTCFYYKVFPEDFDFPKQIK